ncbi:hypothetical protein K490DRAFT_63449 [Saccharata proteae CBS 121410]|uniref:Ubiquitin 3 binding protein But2 C-terminal domain-containing protein n=1 Tax=Saccharata proteae CBS 121410 TaxID=1314787 RepID=A0A6A5YCS4_9PEZI|nr:hypothetical protein K490DRAFT_63449 [Saccharata proteae CBS 121410]
MYLFPTTPASTILLLTLLTTVLASPTTPSKRSVYHHQHTFNLIALPQRFDLSPSISSQPLIAEPIGPCEASLTFAPLSNAAPALLFTAAGKITNSSLTTVPNNSTNTTRPMHLHIPPDLSKPLSLRCASDAATTSLDVAGSFTYRPDDIKHVSGTWIACPSLRYKRFDQMMPDGCVEIELGMQCGDAEGRAPGGAVEVGCYDEGIL